MSEDKRTFNVVLVDDEIWALRGLKGIADWNSYGFNIIGEFTDSEEALECIISKKPDLLFTDIRMPGIDGMTLIDRIKAEGLDTDIVIVTAYRDFEIARQALKNSVTDYIIKPLDKEEVRSALSKIYVSLCEKKNSSLDLERCDLSEAKNREIPLVRDFLTEIKKAGAVRLILSDTPLDLSKFEHHKIYIKGFTCAYFVTGDTPIELFKDFPKHIGISRMYSSVIPFNDMIGEAKKSFMGEFFFSDNEQTAKIEEYIYDNMEEKLTMDSLAAAFYLSKPYIFELFRNYTDTSAMNLLKNIRLSKAASLLAEGKMSVREVAMKVGFDDAGYFGKVFKTKYDCTPEQYTVK